ncbi:MAG TPA: ComF family protein [Dehalococcoidia bacterium]|nr:ComF family protein [Dehalococcoidia bacterium]
MVTRSLTRLGVAALDLVYPPRCALCEKHGSFLCEACRESLPRADGRRCDACWLPLRGFECAACAEHPTALTRLRSVYRYEGGVRSLVQAFKFRGQSSLGKTLAALLVSCYEIQGLAADVIVPVPLTTARRRGRGYNQASLLAREVSRSIGVPVAGGLQRTGKAPPQAQSATAEERRRNVVGAFEVARPGDVVGRRVLLIDDVATTGATLNACAVELFNAGAAEVSGLTLARED